MMMTATPTPGPHVAWIRRAYVGRVGIEGAASPSSAFVQAPPAGLHPGAGAREPHPRGTARRALEIPYLTPIPNCIPRKDL